MKKILFIGFVFILFFTKQNIAFGQATLDKTLTAQVDADILAFKETYTTIPELSKKLTAKYETEEEKVRAIFRWMTNNIAYDCKTFHNNGKIRGLDSKDYNNSKSYYYAIAEHVMKSKKGICSGYTFLFYELCRAAGLKCFIVNGITSQHPKTVNFFRKLNMFNTNHAWNKVKIDNNWYFIDVTWASGSCNRMVTRFKKQLDSNYYLTPENEPYTTHAEEKTESADFNDYIDNPGYPNHQNRHPCLNIFYCTDW